MLKQLQRACLTVMSVLMAYVTIAQNGTSGSPGNKLIRGVVISETGDAVPFANVVLYAPDSSLVTGTTTDDDGLFQLEAEEGSYILKITFLSFEPLVLGDVVKEAGKVKALGNLVLSENAALLDEVVITSERSQMEFQLDKRVFNVGTDLSNAGSNAAEILSNVPSVDVDIEGNVSLRGSENVRILIDGKPSGLASTGDALRMLQGSMIEKIEVITNPSSKYEAEGEVGIINIVLKKERQKGFNGSFELQAGYPTQYGGSFSLNYRRKRINFFASSGGNFRAMPGRGQSFQQYSGPDTSYTFESIRKHVRGGTSSVNRAGADLFLNDKNTLTAAVLYRYSDGNNEALIEYRDMGLANEVLVSTSREEEEKELSHDLEFTLSHVKTFAQKNRKWSSDVRFTKNDDREEANLTETSSLSNVAPSFQRSSNTENEQNFLVNSDYVHPIGEKGKVETGVRASVRSIENFYSVDLRAYDTAPWVPLTDFTDKLLYTENIYAAYALLANEHKRFSYQLGLRAEQTDIKTTLELSGIENPRRYLNLFPSSHLNYKLSEFNSLQLSYSRRLSRPHFRELIPFFSYTDPRFFYGGNPDLNPEYTNSYEAAFMRMFTKGSFLGSLYYRHTSDVVQRITLTDTTGLLRTFPVNLGTQDAYGIELNINYTFTDWWRMNGSVNTYYASIQGDYRGKNYGTELITLTSRVNALLSLPKKFEFQSSLRYRGPRNTPQGRMLYTAVLDLGLARDFFKGNGTLVFSVKDVFNSGKRRWILDTEYLNSESEFQWRLRQFQLTFNYRINQKKQRGGGGRPEGGMEDDF